MYEIHIFGLRWRNEFEEILATKNNTELVVESTTWKKKNKQTNSGPYGSDLHRYRKGHEPVQTIE